MSSSLLVGDESNLKTKTFYNDDKLPSLPVPSVEETIIKYLDSCKPVLSEEKFRKTELICKKFLQEDCLTLQKKLLQRAASCQNWLEDWWLNKVYLETRAPLPIQNFSGPGTYLETVWPLKEGTQLERAALSAYIFMEFWNHIRKELIAPHFVGGKPLTMHQFRYLFNTCRVPQKGKDILKHCFKTESEGGNSPDHIVVLCDGYIFKINGIDSNTGKLVTPSQYYSMFKKIHQKCKLRRKAGPGVAALTALNRDEWAEARSHLCKISSVNQQILDDIETAVFVMAFDNTSPKNYTEMCYESLVGDPNLRWYDKSYVTATTLNGGILCCCDHTPYDAMVIVVMVEFYYYYLHKTNGVWPGLMETSNFTEPVELQFNLDQKALSFITTAKKQLIHIRNNLEVLQPVFTKFGKTALKEINIHPDFMVQLCLQLAYMHVHGKPGPAYETAMTRQFYHGRTETCRTCTPEVVAFCQAMLHNPIIGTQQYMSLVPLLITAQKKFLVLMKECSRNRGCDRHLLGLFLVCVENGYEIPELYTDEAFVASGGNGNFPLSTSCVGYQRGQGVVAPMIENGYGFFYRINDHKIIYSITAYNSCLETSAQQMSDCFQYYMANVLLLVQNQKLIFEFCIERICLSRSYSDLLQISFIY